MEIDEWIAQLCLERDEITQAIRALERLDMGESAKRPLHAVRRAKCRKAEDGGAIRGPNRPGPVLPSPAEG